MIARGGILCALLVAVACSGEQPAPPTRAQLAPRSPEVRILARESLLVTVPTWRAIPEYRIDAVTETLTQVTSILPTPDGGVIVGQARDAQLVAFGPDGRRIWQVGRKGSGPGEFRDMTPGWVGDTIWVYDASLHRVTLISRSGAVLGTRFVGGAVLDATSSTSGSAIAPIRDTSGDGSGAELLRPPVRAVYSDGSFLVDGAADMRDGPIPVNEAVNGIMTVSNGLVTRFVAKRPPNTGAHHVSLASGRGFGFFVPFFAAPHMHVATRGDRVVFATTEMNRLDGGTIRIVALHARSGDTAFVREIAFIGHPVESTEVERYFEGTRQMMGPEAEQEARRFAAGKIPRFRPPLSGVGAGIDGTTWLTVQGPGPGQRYVMLDETGRPALSVVVDANVRIGQASRTHVWAREVDDDGLESVVRFRLEPPPAGAR